VNTYGCDVVDVDVDVDDDDNGNGNETTKFF